MYTIAEFRKNLRKAFNDANEGHEVTIERYGQNFQLVCLVGLPLGGSAFESTPTAVKPIKPLTPEFTPKPEIIKTKQDAEIAIKPIGRDNPTMRLCKNGHIANEFGRCLQKNCKYA